ncbi:MAG: ABC transporter permease [Chloroflexota bacterium]
MSAANPNDRFHIHVEPVRGFALLDLAEIWQYRELLFFLVWRDIKVRYKQTLLGAAWAVLQPVATMVVFSVIFGRLAGMPSDGLPYPLFSFGALLPWQLFSYALNESSNSIVNNQRLVTKIYFPRLVVPAAAVTAGLVDFAIALLVLFGLMLYYGVPLTARLLALPGLVLLALASALAVGLWLSTLNVRYRDVRHFTPFITQLWFYLTPIAYPTSLVPEALRPLYALNPMVGVVEGFRWALLGAQAVDGGVIAVSSAMVLLLLIGGLFYFRSMETVFADLL